MAFERSTMTRPGIRASLVSTLAVIAALSFGCSKAVTEEAAARRPRVTVKPLVLEAWSEVLDVPATAVGNATINVFAKVPGRVSTIVHDEGAYVVAGDILFELDPRDLKTAMAASTGSVAMARAGMAAAQVQRDTASKDDGRIRELLRTSSISAADADRMESAFKAAEAQLGVARAQLEVAQAGQDIARRNLADATVKAAVDGLVSRRTVDVGQETSPAAAMPLAILAAIDPLFVEGSAPEYVLGRLFKGMKSTVTFDGFPGKPFEGTVELVGPIVDPVFKMVRVRVKVPNPVTVAGTRRLVPGMSGMIRLVPEEGRYFVLPLNTVRSQDADRMTLLFVGADGRVFDRRVKPLRRDGLRFLVVDGLEEGLRLVTAGPKDLEAGMLVDIAGQ